MLYSLPSINQPNKNFSCCLLSLFSWIPDLFFFYKNTGNVWTKVITELWMIFLWNVDRIFVSVDFFFFPSSSIHLQGLLGTELYNFVLLRLYFHQILPQEEHSLKHSFWEVGEVPMDLGKPLLSCNVQLLWADNAVSDAGPFLWKLDDSYLSFFLSSGVLLSKSIKS